MGYHSSTGNSGVFYSVVGEAEWMVVVFVMVTSDGAVMTWAQHSAMR